MILRLPQKGRPLGIRYRNCDLGTDLPAEFFDELRSIDRGLYPIFHPFQILWDDLVNEYVGSLEDPRHSVLENSFKAGELILGHILTDGQDRALKDGRWHIWRWCEPARAWAHIIKLESHEPEYLRLVTRKIYLQACFNDRFGHTGFSKMLEEADLERRKKLMEEKRDLMNEIYKTNSSIMNTVAENLMRGKINSTNPQKESIMSFPGQTNKSRTIRPLEDREGGLILP